MSTQLLNQYNDLLLQVCKDKSLFVNYKKLNGGYRFYYVTINKESEKTLFVSAGIHGNEIAGPYTVLKFLDTYRDISPKIKLIFCPMVNPYGFSRQIRQNGLRQDVNRRFCDKTLYGEAKAVYDTIKMAKPDYFLSLHEWSGKDGFYMYASDTTQKEQIEQIPQIAKDNGFKLFNNTKIHGEECVNGIIWHPKEAYKDDRSKCTLENKMYNEGVNYICTETPSKATLKDRVNVHFKIINFVLEKLIKE